MEEKEILRRLAAAEETAWKNPKWRPFAEAEEELELKRKDMEEAAERLRRFAPPYPEVLSGDRKQGRDDRV